MGLKLGSVSCRGLHTAQVSLPLETGAGNQVQGVVDRDKDLKSRIPGSVLYEELRGGIQNMGSMVGGKLSREQRLHEVCD